MKKGIIFDVDGTLWDSSVQVAEAWSQAVKRYPQYPQIQREITPQMVYTNMGKTMSAFADALFPELEVQSRMEVMDACMEYENEYLEDHPGALYPGVKEVFEELSRKYALYIVSNCQKGYIEVMMRSCGLEPFVEDIESYGNTGRPKGENIRLVIERNQIGQCFYVGDTAMDQKASKEAGIPFVYASYGFGTSKEPAAEIGTITELPRVAEQIFEKAERG